MVAVCLFHRERERQEAQGAARSLQSAPALPTKQQQQDTDGLYIEQKIQIKVQMSNLKVGSYIMHLWVQLQVDTVNVKVFTITPALLFVCMF